MRYIVRGETSDVMKLRGCRLLRVLHHGAREWVRCAVEGRIPEECVSIRRRRLRDALHLGGATRLGVSAGNVIEPPDKQASCRAE